MFASIHFTGTFRIVNTYPRSDSANEYLDSLITGRDGTVFRRFFAIGVGHTTLEGGVD